MNTILLNCLFFLLTTNVFSQKNIKGQINYSVKFQINQTKLNNVAKSIKGSKYVKDMALSAVKRNRELNFILLFKDYESFFEEKDELEANNNGFNLTKILAGKGIYYTDKSAKKIINKKESFGEYFLIELPQMNWVLSKESKIIDSYTCFKATCSRKVEGKQGVYYKEISAWYTPSIPVNFGPKDYFGLPGLILELKEGDLLYKATKIELNPHRAINIKVPKKGNKVTLDQYTDIVKKMINSNQN